MNPHIDLSEPAATILTPDAEPRCVTFGELADMPDPYRVRQHEAAAGPVVAELSPADAASYLAGVGWREEAIVLLLRAEIQRGERVVCHRPVRIGDRVTLTIVDREPESPWPL